MLAFLRQRWFLLALIGVLVSGMVWPQVVGPMIGVLPSDAVVAAVTFVMALPLETGALWNAARRPGPAWLGAVLNSGVAPPLGWLASRVLPTELALGVIVATTVPCTLATAAVFTRRARGHDAVAFLVTIITNLACFLVVPGWLWLLVGEEAQADIRNAKIDYGSITLGLIFLVVLPIIVAQLMRQHAAIGSWATRRKEQLSLLAQIGVLTMVLIGAVSCGHQLSAAESRTVLTATNIALMFAAVTLVHGTLLVLGFRLSRLLRFARADAIPVAFSGSQKTLMVGAYLALAVGPLAIVPMVAYHAVQLVIDTLVADKLRSQDLAAAATASAAVAN